MVYRPYRKVMMWLRHAEQVGAEVDMVKVASYVLEKGQQVNAGGITKEKARFILAFTPEELTDCNIPVKKRSAPTSSSFQRNVRRVLEL